MLVKDRMSRNLFTITKDEKINKAIDIMKSHGFHRLPVVDGTRLIGLISEGMIDSKGGTKATSLSIFELNYLLSKTSVETIMEKHVHTVYDDQFVEDAAVKMLEYNIGCLPVLNREENLIGILTQNDLFKAFIDILGYSDKGIRLCIEVKDGVGVLEKVSNIISKVGGNILHLGAYAGELGMTNIVFRIESAQEEDLKQMLAASGYKILSIDENKKNK